MFNEKVMSDSQSKWMLFFCDAYTSCLDVRPSYLYKIGDTFFEFIDDSEY